ncbi:SDR family NAD(P)-dependent oxidoreductase [Paraburkholderia sp. GAS32]|uniref:SDR family NAD(P)-dependent oxidoreductase n=1 Tax=Paraburkholderia sp. GAS32 TaxID=3035129 RepID=UPI003D1B3DF7
MNLNLRDRVVLIVGGSSGIGAATARVLSREGAKLTLVARRQRELDAIERELMTDGAQVLSITGDASIAGVMDDVVARVVSHFSALHCLAVVAGPMGARAPLHELDDNDWELYFQQSLMVAVRSCRAALPALLEAPDSAIVLTSAFSIRAQKSSLVAYTAMKSAIASVAKNIARTYGSKGLRANCIAPGVIDRDAQTNRALAAKYDVAECKARYEQVRRESGMSVALERAGRHEEFADLIAYLLSARASYVTGATVNIDGGTDF